MKTFPILFVAALALAVPAFADDAHHPPGDAALPVAPQNPEANLQQMQDNVKKMQTQLDELGRTKDSEERQKLLGEHLQTMRENMMLGHEIAGGSMAMGGAAMPMEDGCMMGGQGMAMLHEASVDRIQQLERRMDMMQAILERAVRSAESVPGSSENSPGEAVR